MNLVRYTKTTVAYPLQSDVTSAGSWQAVTNVDDANPGYMPTVSTDAAANPHIAWSGSKASGSVFYKNKATGAWQSTITWSTSYTGLSVDVSPTNDYVSLARVAGNWWWDPAYLYREPVIVTAGSAAVAASYSVPVTFNHATLVSGGKSLASGNDARVVYLSGSTWTELDRVLDPASSWNNAATKVWFRTQAAIAASGSDANYYLYYGNAAAGSPPANKGNIFLFYDDFETGNLNKWTVKSGGLWQAASDQAHAGTYALKYPADTEPADRYIDANPALYEGDVYFDAWWRFSATTIDIAQEVRRWSPSLSSYETNLQGATGWDIAKEIGGSWTELNPSAGTPTANTWTRIGIGIAGTGTRVFKDGAQINPGSGSLAVGLEQTTGSFSFRKYNVPSGVAWWIDDVVGRKYVDPEPSAAAASEQTPQVDVQYTTCRNLASSLCDAAVEFTKFDTTAGFEVVATGVSIDSYPSLATTFETNGDLWVAYAKQVDSTTRAIYARFLDYPATGWAAAETIDSLSGTIFAKPSIGIDQANNVHALYVSVTASQVYYKSRVSGTWSSRTAVEQGTSDNPTLMVRAPNDATYGGTPGGLYWKTSSSETYFFQIPEFGALVIPAILALILVSSLRGTRPKLRRNRRATRGQPDPHSADD
jgi:hypothetical protein